MARRNSWDASTPSRPSSYRSTASSNTMTSSPNRNLRSDERGSYTTRNYGSSSYSGLNNSIERGGSSSSSRTYENYGSSSGSYSNNSYTSLSNNRSGNGTSYRKSAPYSEPYKRNSRSRQSGWSQFERREPRVASRRRRSFDISDIFPMAYWVLGGIVVLAIIIYFVNNGEELIQRASEILENLAASVMTFFIYSAIIFGVLNSIIGKRLSGQGRLKMYIIICVLLLITGIIPGLGALLTVVVVSLFLIKFMFSL